MKAAANREQTPPAAPLVFPRPVPGAGAEPPPDCIAYLQDADIAAFQRAYRFAELAHTGQFRKDGKPYITHPLAVAEILAEWQLDA